MKKINLYGIGGHYKVVNNIAKTNGFNVINIFDDDKNKFKNLDHYKGNFDDLIRTSNNNKDFYTFVCIGNNRIRKNKLELLEKNNIKIATLVHPNSSIDSGVQIGIGTVIMNGANLNISSQIGKGCIINTGCNIDHDVFIGDFTHICPGTTIAGNVNIGKLTQIGSSNTIINNLVIGNNVESIAGLTIYKNISDNKKLYSSKNIIEKKND